MQLASNAVLNALWDLWVSKRVKDRFLLVLVYYLQLEHY